MKSLDNTIKYYELLMKCDDLSSFDKYELPSGFHFEFYKSGDELSWVNIHIGSGEFTSVDQGLEWFHKFFDSFIDSLDKRCIFIVDSSTLEKIGTATVSLLKDKEYGYSAAIDWVAIRRDYQGRKLARPLITKFMEVARDLGHTGVILHTQTTTWLAAKLYLDFGFDILNTDSFGWRILKTLTNHEKLSLYDDIPLEEVYDLRNIAIEKKLVSMYNTSFFNYAIWDKSGRHDVYTYIDGIHHEYEYFVDDGIILKEVKK